MASLTSTITIPTSRAIDREKVCPLLLRVFPKVGAHHQISEYQVKGKEPLEDEVQIYTWKDATLRELTELIKEVHDAARRRPARLSYAFVYPDRRGRAVMREVGLVSASRSGADDSKTLEQLQFETGDFLDVAVLL